MQHDFLFNPWRPQSFFGLDVIEAQKYPKYQLPDDVPVTEEFRSDFNKWALEFFGYTTLIPQGTVYVLGNGFGPIVMHPKDIVQINNIC